MSVGNKKKDHLKKYGGIELITPAAAPTSDDPLRFWTCHPTENTLIDLHEFADGVSKTGNPTGGGMWGGGFSGRPNLIAELAPAIHARCTLLTRLTSLAWLGAVRTLWRVCDELESSITADGLTFDRLTSVKQITHLHEAAMHRAKVNRLQFNRVVSLIDDVRRLKGLRALLWTPPRNGEPNRLLVPDSHAKALKIGIKRDWERVRKTWERNDAIRGGTEPDTLNEFEKKDPAVVQKYAEENRILRQQWLHFARIQESTGKQNPTSDELYDGKTAKFHQYRGFYVSKVRSIAFPTCEEANIAFHSALMRSGWNPSTLINGIDATLPNSIFNHPKDTKQTVLSVEAIDGDESDGTKDLEEFHMQASKRRAGGRLQFCTGLKKDPDSPPNIVAAYLERTKDLRIQLNKDVKQACIDYERLKAHGTDNAAIERQFKKIQTLQQGTRNVWLYVDLGGDINWLDGSQWRTFSSSDSTDHPGKHSYLDQVISRLNAQREMHGEDPIAVVSPSDFRDIYARWVYVQSGGNILAVMIALGHSTLRSTDNYLDNNIFSAENDEAVRKFMTHMFDQLAVGRLDLTILSQLVRHGPITDEMLSRLTEYRSLTRSRVNVACADVRNPPAEVDPSHIEGKRCGTHRCLKECPNARFLPESLEGIAMRIEELAVIFDHMSLDVWIKDGFDKELDAAEYVLTELFVQKDVEKARMHWREKILTGKHLVPGIGFMCQQGNT